MDLGLGKNRMGGSILAQTTQRFGDTAPDCEDPTLLGRFVTSLRKLELSGCVMSYHDRADGGLFAAAAEMQFASRIGIRLTLDSLLEVHGATVLNTLFNEELGALIQVPSDRVKEVVAEMRAAGLADCCHFVGEFIKSDALEVCANGETLAVFPRENSSPPGAKLRISLPAAATIRPAQMKSLKASLPSARRISLPRRRSMSTKTSPRPSLPPAFVRRLPSCVKKA